MRNITETCQKLSKGKVFERDNNIFNQCFIRCIILVTTGHLTESASCISKQAMPMHWQICVHSSPGRGLCLYNSTCKKENIYKHYSFKLLLAELPVATYKIFTNLWLDFTYGSQFSKLQLYLWAHRKKKLTSRISHLQIFELSINNYSPFPMIEVLV